MYYILILIAFLCGLHLLLNYNAKARTIMKIPGPPGRFIIMNASDIMLPPVELFKLCRDFARRYNDIYRFWSYPFGAVNIYNPDDIELILSNSKYNEKSIVYKFMRPWLGDGLLLSKGSKWQQRRKILTPAFHFNILRYFTEVLEENSQTLIDKLDNDEGHVTIDLVPLISEYTLHSICETSMGTRLNEETTDAGRSYKETIYKVGRLLVDRLTKIYLFNDFIYQLTPAGRLQDHYLKSVHGFTRKVIEDRKTFVEKHGIKLHNVTIDDDDEDIYIYNRKNKISMLDLLILAKRENVIDDKGIQEEVDTFMFEGHDTTAAGLIYLLMLLANHKDIQENIVAEINDIFGESSRSATMQDLMKMKYLDCCIKESLRLYPPVAFISREIHEPTVLSNYMVPAGTHCHIHIYDLHRREDLFKDATKFIPERFLPENSAGRHPYSYIPFSAGPRNCIGQRFAMLEIKSAVSRILKKYKLRAVTTPEEITFKSDVVLRSVEPVNVAFVKRK